MWDYAALTQSAARYGGPDAFVRAVQRQGFARGVAGGIASTVLAGGAIALSAYLSYRKTQKMVAERGAVLDALRPSDTKAVDFVVDYGQGMQVEQIVDRVRREVDALDVPVRRISLSIELGEILRVDDAMAIEAALLREFGDRLDDNMLLSQGSGREGNLVHVHIEPMPAWTIPPKTTPHNSTTTD